MKIFLFVLSIASVSFAGKCPELAGQFSCKTPDNKNVVLNLKKLDTNKFFLGDMVVEDGVKQSTTGMGMMISVSPKCDNSTLSVQVDVLNADNKKNIGSYEQSYSLDTNGDLVMRLTSSGQKNEITCKKQ